MERVAYRRRIRGQLLGLDLFVRKLLLCGNVRVVTAPLTSRRDKSGPSIASAKTSGPDCDCRCHRCLICAGLGGGVVETYGGAAAIEAIPAATAQDCSH